MISFLFPFNENALPTDRYVTLPPSSRLLVDIDARNQKGRALSTASIPRGRIETFVFLSLVMADTPDSLTSI